MRLEADWNTEIAVCDLHAEHIEKHFYSERSLGQSGQAQRGRRSRSAAASADSTVARIEQLYAAKSAGDPLAGFAAFDAAIRHFASIVARKR